MKLKMSHLKCSMNLLIFSKTPQKPCVVEDNMKKYLLQKITKDLESSRRKF